MGALCASAAQVYLYYYYYIERERIRARVCVRAGACSERERRLGHIDRLMIARKQKAAQTVTWSRGDGPFPAARRSPPPPPPLEDPNPIRYTSINLSLSLYLFRPYRSLDTSESHHVFFDFRRASAPPLHCLYTLIFFTSISLLYLSFSDAAGRLF